MIRRQHQRSQSVCWRRQRRASANRRRGIVRRAQEYRLRQLLSRRELFGNDKTVLFVADNHRAFAHSTPFPDFSPPGGPAKNTALRQLIELAELSGNDKTVLCLLQITTGFRTPRRSDGKWWFAVYGDRLCAQKLF